MLTETTPTMEEMWALLRSESPKWNHLPEYIITPVGMYAFWLRSRGFDVLVVSEQCYASLDALPYGQVADNYVVLMDHLLLGEIWYVVQGDRPALLEREYVKG